MNSAAIDMEGGKALRGWAYVRFLLLPPLVIGMILGLNQFGPARFDNRLMHIVYAFVTVLFSWLSMEGCSQLATRMLRAWRLPLWLVLALGVVLAAQLHAPFTVLRDALFVPFLRDGSRFFPTWPWNYGDANYLTESLFAVLNRLVVWLAANMLLMEVVGYRRFGYRRFFAPPYAEPASEERDARRAVPAERARETPQLDVLLRRLPAPIGHDIVCLRAREHYTEVVTSAGQALIYMRFSDAMALAEAGIEGVQLHRSVWVARRAVTAVERENGRLLVRLGDGTRVAVSRTYLAQVREQFGLGAGSAPLLSPDG
jgi:hypothetical protein